MPTLFKFYVNFCGLAEFYNAVLYITSIHFKRTYISNITLATFFKQKECLDYFLFNVMFLTRTLNLKNLLLDTICKYLLKTRYTNNCLTLHHNCIAFLYIVQRTQRSQFLAFMTINYHQRLVLFFSYSFE